MLKTAYIFHGHARTWGACYQNFFNNVFSALPGDIFIHTWDTINPSFGSWWKGYREFTDEEKIIAEQTPDFNGIYQAYKPKVLLIEQDPSYHTSNETPLIRSSVGTKNMLESSRKVFEIACNYDNYDVFFSTRMDLNYTSPLDISEYEDRVLMTPDVNLPYDIWMYGNKELMDIKTNYVNHVQQYWLDKDPSSWIHYCYEHAIGQYFRDNNISLKQSSLQYNTIRIF
jgi:hypothetical protein